jgi:cell pole-organizing protein PopZ
MMRPQALFIFVPIASVFAGSASAARIDCAANPFHPYCCPSPCPVSDGGTHNRLNTTSSLAGSITTESNGIRINTNQMREIIGKPQQVNGPIHGIFSQYPPLWQTATKGASPEALAAVRRILDSTNTLSPQLRGAVATPHTWMQPLPKAVQVIDERVKRGPDQRTWYSSIDIDTAQTLQRAEQVRGTVSQGTEFGLEVPSTVPNQPQRDEPWGTIYGNPVPVDPPTKRPQTPKDRLLALLELLAKLAIQLALSQTANSIGTATADFRATQQAIASLVSQLTSLLGQTYENPAAAAQALAALAASQDPTSYTSGHARDAASVASATAAAQAFLNNPGSFGATKPIICDGAGGDKVCGLPMASPDAVRQIIAELRNQQKYAAWVGNLAVIETQTRTSAATALAEGGGTPSAADFTGTLAQAIALADQISPATAASLRAGNYIISLSEI